MRLLQESAKLLPVDQWHRQVQMPCLGFSVPDPAYYITYIYIIILNPEL
jgi:hypothetical protein